MTSKERVRIALQHEEPDRIPVNVTFVPEIAKLLRDKYKVKGDIGVFLGNDAVCAPGGFETSYYQDNDTYYCRYGVKWRKVSNQSSTYTEMIEHPLAGSKDKLIEWKIPDYEEPSQYDFLREQIKNYGTEKWVVGTVTCTIFETSWALRGLDQLLFDMVEDEDYANALFDKVMEFPLQAGLKYIDLGVDMVWVGDDVAMQTGMMISPALFRKYLKPRFAKLIAEYKRRNRNVKVMYHSCGNAQQVLSDLIEIGVDVLHSLQPKAIDVDSVKRQFGDKLALWGGMDIQQLMPFGTANEIKNEVKRLINVCGKKGGYVLAPAHHIQADTPIENIEAFYAAASEYGIYAK